MHFGDFEDDNLEDVLTKSAFALRIDCGDYNMTDPAFEELVFERSRYVYNDALEYFEDNFLSEINKLSLRKALEEMGKSDETI